MQHTFLIFVWRCVANFNNKAIALSCHKTPLPLVGNRLAPLRVWVVDKLAVTTPVTPDTIQSNIQNAAAPEGTSNRDESVDTDPVVAMLGGENIDDPGSWAILWTASMIFFLVGHVQNQRVENEF